MADKLYKRGFWGDALSVIVHAKVAARYGDDFRNAGMIRVFAEAVWAR